MRMWYKLTIIFLIAILCGCTTTIGALQMPLTGGCYHYAAAYLVYGDTPDAHVVLERDKHLYPDAFGQIEPIVARYSGAAGYPVYRDGQFTRDDIKKWIADPGKRVVIVYLWHAAPARTVSDLLFKPIREVHVVRI